jgi:CRP-like cAMP-binding protein
VTRPTISRLRDLELFHGCRRADLATIDRTGTTLDVPSGRILCTEGSVGEEFFVLITGLAEVATATGRVAMLGPGGWFGEVALLKGTRRRASVVTMTSSTLLVFGLREFRTLLDIIPVRARLEFSAQRIVDDSTPIPRPTYQPLAEGFLPRVDVTAPLLTEGLPGFPL